MAMGYWKLILVLIVHVQVCRSSPLYQYNPQDEPDGQGINSPTDEQERSGDPPNRPRLGSTHNPNIRHIDPGHDGGPAEEEGGEKINPAVQETTAPHIDGDTFGPDIHVNQPTEGSQSTPSTRRPSTLPVSRHDPEEDKPKKEPGGAVLPLTPSVPIDTTTPTTPRTPPTKKTKPPPITTSSTAAPTETPGTTVTEKPVKPVISTPSTKEETTTITTTPMTTTSPSTTQTKEETTTPSVSVKSTLSTTFSNTQSVLSTTHKFVEKSTTPSTEQSATSTTSTPSSTTETTESSTLSQTSYPETKKIESSTPTQSTGSSIYTKAPTTPNTSTISFETTSTTKSEPKTPESTSTSSVTAMTTSGTTIQTTPEPKSTTLKPTVTEPITTSTKSSTKHFTSNPTTPATPTQTQHTSTTGPSVTVTTTESTSLTMTSTLPPQSTSPHASQSSIKTETFNPTTSTSDSPTSKTSATTKHQTSVITRKDLSSSVSTGTTPSTAKTISTVSPKTSSVHPQRETSTSSMDTTVIKTSKQTTATKPTTVTSISTTKETTVRTSSADVHSTEQSSPTTRVFTTSNNTTSPPTSTGTPSTVTTSSETTTSISNKPSKQPSKSPTTTQQSKSTTSKVTSPGRTTVHPTVLPPTYLIVRLQMRWDSFCIIIEKFKDLLLGYIDADEEASVELLENECEYYELKEKQSIIRRDVSRQLEKRDIVHDQYYNQNYDQKRKNQDEITVKVYIKNDEGRADKALTQKVFDSINQLGNGQRLPKGFEYFDGKIRSVQIRGPTTEKLHPGIEVEAKMTTPIIVAITTVMSVCLISLIIISAVIYRRKTQRGRRSMRPSIRGYPDDDNFSLSSFSTSSFRRSKQRIGRQSLKSIATINQGFCPDEHTYTNSMTLNKLSLRSLEMDYLEEELKSIPSNMPKMSALPPGAQAKNRYANVIPLESSRVTLKSRPASGCSQYINANYVSGYNGVPKVYIATQAPLETTVKDFWSMVWENQSQVIVMMMDWVEDGQRRCADYLPQSDAVGDSIAVYGDYEIFMKKQIIGDHYIFSCLTLKNMELNLCRDMVHFQYLDFPTKGSPSSVGSFLNFIKEMRPYMEVSHGPSVVHCSTGTGRTGTLMAIDLCMQAYDDSQSVDIMNCVYRIRNERAGAVHTTSHYAFIYKTMLEYANRTGASNSPSKWSSMSSLG